MNKITTLILALIPSMLMSQYGKTELKRTIKPKATPVYNAKLKTPIRGGVDVEVLEFENNYWLIKYDTIIGWVYPKDLFKTSVMYARMMEVNELAEKAKNVDKKVRLIEKWGEINANKIMNRQVWIGMTKDMLVESRGYPDDRNTTKTAGSLHEQWIYGKDISSRKYIYLDNRVVTAIQN
jgi:hypothetical protein